MLSVLRILKLIVNCLCVQKENTKQKELSCLVDSKICFFIAKWIQNKLFTKWVEIFVKEDIKWKFIFSHMEVREKLERTPLTTLCRYQFDRLPPTPRANPLATNFSRQKSTPPGKHFSAKLWPPGRKREIEIPPPGTICLVRMIRYQWKRNIIL